MEYMEYFVYVLKDEAGKFYKGLTSDLHRRIKQHKAGHTRSTKHMQNIVIAYFEKYNVFENARKRELYFKSAAGRKFLKKQIK